MKILDIALKDLTRSARSLFLVGMTLVAPLLITGLMYFAFGSMKSGDVSMTAIKVGVVNADTLLANAPFDVSLGENIRSMFFDDSVKSWISASDYPDEASARAALNGQEIGVALIIPATFTAERPERSIMRKVSKVGAALRSNNASRGGRFVCRSIALARSRRNVSAVSAISVRLVVPLFRIRVARYGDAPL